MKILIKGLIKRHKGFVYYVDYQGNINAYYVDDFLKEHVNKRVLRKLKGDKLL